MRKSKKIMHLAMQCCSQFCISALQLRTRSMHKEHCERLITIGTGASQAYGIQRDAALNKLTYFHVVDGLAPDVMHDMLEGTVNCEVKTLIKTYTEEKMFFTLSQLNRRVKFFK